MESSLPPPSVEATAPYVRVREPRARHVAARSVPPCLLTEPSRRSEPAGPIVCDRKEICGSAPADTGAPQSPCQWHDTLAELIVHDLKSPLSSVLVNLDFAEERATTAGEDPELGEALREASDGVRRVTRMVHDLLDVARLEGGVFPIAALDADLVTTAREALADARTQALAHGVRLVLEAPPRLAVAHDAGAIRRVLVNLLENAVRYSPRGGRVTIALAPGASVRVTDEGPGIPPALRARIFEKFARADPAQGRSAGTHGLGLTFVRLAVRAHGGEIEALEGPGGQGATFAFTLPARTG